MYRIGTVCDAEGGRYSNCGSMLYPHYYLSTASDGWAKANIVRAGVSLHFVLCGVMQPLCCTPMPGLWWHGPAEAAGSVAMPPINSLSW